MSVVIVENCYCLMAVHKPSNTEQAVTVTVNSVETSLLLNQRLPCGKLPWKLKITIIQWVNQREMLDFPRNLVIVHLTIIKHHGPQTIMDH